MASGILDQSADSENLKQGSKVELPFWMVPTLHAKKIITFEVPRYYKVNYRYNYLSPIMNTEVDFWSLKVESVVQLNIEFSS